MTEFDYLLMNICGTFTIGFICGVFYRWFDYRPIRGVFVDQEGEYILLSPATPLRESE